MKKLAVLVTMLATLVAGGAVSAAPFPSTFPLPDGYFPEGIAVGRGTTFYVGSLADGSVYRGDLRTGEGDVLVPAGIPFSTVGIEVDRRNRIWVAGGPSGTGRVYDGNTGELLAAYAFTDPFASFINDVVVTGDAAYFTDSGTANNPNPAVLNFAGEPRLFVVPLGKGGSLPDPGAVTELATTAPDVVFPNLNGIETSPDGKSLIVGHTVGEVLFQVDPATGDATAIDAGVPLIGNDGIIRRGTTLYVVENALAQVSALKLSADGSSASLQTVYPVTGSQTPTTAGLFGNALYLVDARFATMDGPYEVFRVGLN